MQRISISWIMDVGQAVDGLALVTRDKAYSQVWSFAWSARSHIEAVFCPYRPSLGAVSLNRSDCSLSLSSRMAAAHVASAQR